MANNKITVKAFNNIIDNDFSDGIVVEWHGATLEIKRCIGLKDMVAFVENIVQNCYDEDSGVYSPELLDTIIRREVMTRYANFSLPTSSERVYRAVYCTDAYDVILENINTDQLDAIISSALQKINYLKERQINIISNKLDGFVDKMGELEDLMADLVSNVTPEDISKIASSIAGGTELDYDAIVRAFNNLPEEIKSGSVE